MANYYYSWRNIILILKLGRNILAEYALGMREDKPKLEKFLIEKRGYTIK